VGGLLGLLHPHLVALLHLQQRNLFHHDEVEEPERGSGGKKERGSGVEEIVCVRETDRERVGTD